MTKRFYRNRGTIWENDKSLSLGDVEDRLNELHEDNQLLHKMNAETIDFMYDNFDMNRMFTDRELNDICNEQGLELSEKGIKIDQLEKENEQLKDALNQRTEQCDKYYEENEQLKQSNERLLKMLDNVANYMQKENKYMPIDDFVEWWNGIATKGLDGDVE